MTGLLWGVVNLVAVAVAPVVLLAALVARRRTPRLPARWHHPRRSASTPLPRSLEDVSADVRRIGARYHQEGMRFAQLEGRRRSYDRALATAASMLEVDHLLTVLPAGDELDVERARVERVLACYGVLAHHDRQ